MAVAGLQPKKDGREDPLDALRYDCIMFNWHESALDQKYKPRKTTSLGNRRVKTGGAKTRGF